MPHVSSIFTKLVSAVTIVMASSDATRNAMKCEFFRNKIVLPSILLFLDAYEFDDTTGCDLVKRPRIPTAGGKFTL